MPVIIGPDGFLCSRDDPGFAFHAFLNQSLTEQAKQRPSAAHALAGADVARIKRELSKEQLVGLVFAALDRAGWIDEHAGEISNPGEWRTRLGNVLYHLYGLRLPFSSPEMCRLIESGNGKAPPVGRVAEYFQDHDLTPQLCIVLRRWREIYKANIGHKYRHVDVQYEMQVLDMLLWHDEGDELDLAACWSERVRRDYRVMEGDRRRRWQALLRHLRGDAGAKPPKPWVKEAQRRLDSVGAEDFRATMTAWLASFQDPGPFQLSVVGSHVLKGLLWYCALARDPAVTEAALPILDANWKPKRNLDKVMVALALVIDTMPLDQAWAALLPLQSAWGASQGQIERLVIRIAAEFGISEEQLRAQDVLKPVPLPTVRPERSPQWLALASLSQPQSAEQFLSTLVILRSRR